MFDHKICYIFNASFGSNAAIAQLVRALACRNAAYRSKDDLKLSGISVEAKFVGDEYANTEGTSPCSQGGGAVETRYRST